MSNTNRRTITAIALLVLSGVCCAGWSRAAVAYVVEPGTGGVIPGKPYNTWTNAATNIVMAVDYVAASGDVANTVWVSNGTYVLTGQVTVTNNMAIIGANNMPIVDGGGNYRCFYFNAGITGALENLFITGGYAAPGDPDGAGVYMYNGVLRNCVFSNNVAATNGGGLYSFNQGGGVHSIMVANCDFIANRAGNDGGGIYSCAAVITDCRISDNHAAVRGGGAGARYGSGNIFSNCVIRNNTSREYGGGLFLYSNNEIYGCVIVSNRAAGAGGGNRGGGGVYMSRVTSVIKNSTIAHNVSSLGGGILMLGGRIYNSLIANNSASLYKSAGGGVCCIALSGSGYPCCFHNCTIAGNYAGSDSAGGVHAESAKQSQIYENTIIYLNSNSVNSAADDYFLADSSDIALINCCLAREPVGLPLICATNNIAADPLFVDHASGDYRLQPSSPCINRGINRDWMYDSLDLDNAPRIRNVIVDMGCYERFMK